MIKLSELQPGDLVLANYEGQQWQGIVKDLNREDREVCIETNVQQFWFKPSELQAIPLDESQLTRLNFQKQENEDGVKYLKGAFRILVPTKGSFGNFEMWYREDRRHISKPIAVHELQNHYYQMTKVELNED